MTTYVSSSASSRRTSARRTGRAAALLGAPALVLLAAPAHADVPEGWAEVSEVDPLHALLLIVGAPLGLFLLIALAVYLPAMVRGERLLPDHASHGASEGQWIGGPRQGVAELPAADGNDSQAGGARGTW